MVARALAILAAVVCVIVMVLGMRIAT